MKESKASRMLRETRERAGKTQEQLSIDLFQSRTYITKQESGARKITPSVTQHMTKLTNSPWMALEAAKEYTGWGPTRMDGPAVDLHRSSVKEKAMEELQEAIEAMEKAKLTIHPSFAQSFELQDIERSCRESIDVIHAFTTYVATVCENYNISWTSLWDDHYRKLQSRGYVTT